MGLFLPRRAYARQPSVNSIWERSWEEKASACVAGNTGAKSKEGLVNRKQHNTGPSLGADRIPPSDGFVNVKAGR